MTPSERVALQIGQLVLQVLSLQADVEKLQTLIPGATEVSFVSS